MRGAVMYAPGDVRVEDRPVGKKKQTSTSDKTGGAE
jgi:hypothetical protein